MRSPATESSRVRCTDTSWQVEGRGQRLRFRLRGQFGSRVGNPIGRFCDTGRRIRDTARDRATAPSDPDAPQPRVLRRASDALDLVLRLPFFDSLPLLVARIIGAAAGERFDVIDDISRAAVRVTRLRHEESPPCLAPNDVTLCIPA